MDPLEKAVNRTGLEHTIEASVSIERERCARIAESFAVDYGADIGKMAKRIAEVIRRQPRAGHG